MPKQIQFVNFVIQLFPAAKSAKIMLNCTKYVLYVELFIEFSIKYSLLCLLLAVGVLPYVAH